MTSFWGAMKDLYYFCGLRLVYLHLPLSARCEKVDSSATWKTRGGGSE